MAIGGQICGDGDRSAVEVAARDDVAGLGEDHRVVGGGVGFDLDRPRGVSAAHLALRHALAAHTAPSRRPARARSRHATR